MSAAGASPAVAGTRDVPVANPLFEYLLRVADDRLVLGHRLSEWCGHGPILEEDIALANIALDHVGQAAALLELAGRVEGAGRDADALAYLRDERDFRNALLVEQPNGDFGMTMTRQFLFDAYSVLYLGELAGCGHAELAALAAKALKEDTYHLRHSGEWMLRLGDGTEESHARAQAALDVLWRFTSELFEFDDVDEGVGVHGIHVDRKALRPRWMEVVGDIAKRATLSLPSDDQPMATGGRRGRHTEHLGHMLSDMQIVARSHPGASW
jgi:ring-1,2-phenylacetyl-CoA epoxidase subunit PaaC